MAAPNTFSSTIMSNGTKRRSSISIDPPRKLRKLTINDLLVKVTTHIYSFLCESLRSSALPYCLQRFPGHAIPDIIRCKNSEGIINGADELGNTAIFYALLHPCYVIEELINAGAEIHWKNLSGQTVLHLLAQQTIEYASHAIRIIEARGNIDTKDNLGDTPLHLATMEANIDLIKLLLAQKANTNITDMDDMTALCIAAAAGEKDIVNVLLENEAGVNLQDIQGKTALHTAAAAGEKDIVNVLLENEAGVNIQDIEGKTALYWTLRRNLDISAALLVVGIEVNMKDIKGDTPLHGAGTGLTELLIKYGSEVDARNRKGMTALHVAQKSVAEILIANHADLNLKDTQGKTPLHHAVETTEKDQGIDLANTLLKSGAEADMIDSNGKTPLHYVAKKSESSLITLLLTNGANALKKDRSVRTPLHYAAANDATNTCAILRLNFLSIKEHCRHIGRGIITKTIGSNRDCDDVINERDSEGATALLHAIRMRQPVAAIALLVRGANVNIADGAGITPLMAAVKSTNDDIRRTAMEKQMPAILIAYGAVSTIRDVSGNTVFHYAAEAGMVSHIPISHSANINALNADGNTAFHYGIFCSQTVEALTERGADASIPNKDGRTVIHLLSEMNHCRTGYYEIQTILEKNPDLNLNLLDRWGNTALDLAQENRVKICLIAAGASYGDSRVPTQIDSDGEFLF